MLITAVFDREVNCRRAASASFQENVGRQGAHSFPYGLEIMAIADYQSLGSRTSAYLNIGAYVRAHWCICVCAFVRMYVCDVYS